MDDPEKTPEKIVKVEYPDAEAICHQPVHELGQSTLYQESSWSIASSPGLGARELGIGTTQEEAWSDAAKRILKDAE